MRGFSRKSMRARRKKPADVGTIKAYATKNKGRLYEVWYRKPDGSRGHDRGFKLKRDAEAHLASVEVAKLRGGYIDRADAKATVAELGAEWLARHKAKVTVSSHHSVDSAWRVHVLPRWGHYAVGAVTRREVEAWLTDLGRTRSHTTVARARDLLAGIFDDAIEDNRVLKNPARGLTIKRKPIPDEVFLDHAQVEELALASRYPDLIRFLAYTGLRWGEATALRVRNVDRQRRRAHIREAVADVNGTHHLGSVKSHEKRLVAYPEFLDGAIERACRGKSPDSRLWGAQRVVPPARKHLRRVVRRRGASLHGRRSHFPPCDPARSASHRCVSRHQRGGQRQGRAAHARAQVREGDTGHVRSPVSG